MIGAVCRTLGPSQLLADGTHFVGSAYEPLAKELQARAAAEGNPGAGGDTASGMSRDQKSEACHAAEQPRCECHLCGKASNPLSWQPLSWRLGRRPSPCAKSDAPADASSAEDAGETIPSSQLATTYSCEVGLVPARRAPIALFSLAAYASLDASGSSSSTRTSPGWMDAAVHSWHANGDLLHTYVLATARPPSHWAPPGSNVALLRFPSVPSLFASLLRFADIPAASTPGGSKASMPRAASFAPLLASFAEAACGLDLEQYAYFGSIELDVILGDLRPFVAPYMGHLAQQQPEVGGSEKTAEDESNSDADGMPFDAIALRWAPPSRWQWRSVDDAVSFNTLADVSHGAVPLSTPLLLMRNNATTRLLWWRAEQWLRTREVSGAYSLRKAMTCRTCTGPLYWFDEHNFANFWRHELVAVGGSGRGQLDGSSDVGGYAVGADGRANGGVHRVGQGTRVAFVCCAFDDHHSSEPRTDGSGGGGEGCVVTWSAPIREANDSVGEDAAREKRIFGVRAGTHRLVRTCENAASYSGTAHLGVCVAVRPPCPRSQRRMRLDHPLARAEAFPPVALVVPCLPAGAMRAVGCRAMLHRPTSRWRALSPRHALLDSTSRGSEGGM